LRDGNGVASSAWSGGDQAALDRLASLVYDELHRMARRYMRNERTGNTLQTTVLVNEVFLRLVEVNNVDWRSVLSSLPSPPR